MSGEVHTKMKMNNIWFSSDFHGFHKNICRGTSTWGKDTPKEPISGTHSAQTTRDFATVEEMNKALWKGINGSVGEDDTLYFLGDWTFDGLPRIWQFRREIKCKNIHFVYGNHDEHIEADRELPNVHIGFNWKGEYHVADGPCPRASGYDKGHIRPARPSDIFSSLDYYKHFSVGKQEFILSHYAFRVWNRSHHGAIHLYGHSHDSLDRDGEEWGRSEDVGIDSAFRKVGSYRPLHIDEIMSTMSKRAPLIVDHHNKNTT